MILLHGYYGKISTRKLRTNRRIIWSNSRKNLMKSGNISFNIKNATELSGRTKEAEAGDLVLIRGTLNGENTLEVDSFYDGDDKENDKNIHSRGTINSINSDEETDKKTITVDNLIYEVHSFTRFVDKSNEETRHFGFKKLVAGDKVRLISTPENKLLKVIRRIH